MLRNYRATPHATTGVSPAELFFGRKLRTKLPEQISKPDIDHNAVCERDTTTKRLMKDTADSGVHASPSELEVGTRVLVRQVKKSTLTPYYNARPYTVTRKKGSMITALCGPHWITRNSSHFKKITPTLPEAATADTASSTDVNSDDDDHPGHFV